MFSLTSTFYRPVDGEGSESEIRMTTETVPLLFMI